MPPYTCAQIFGYIMYGPTGPPSILTRGRRAEIDTPNNADTTLPICGHTLGTNGHVVPPPFGRQITYALFAQALATKFSSGKAVHHN